MKKEEDVDKLFRDRLRDRQFEATDEDWHEALDVIQQYEGSKGGTFKWITLALIVIGVAVMTYVAVQPQTSKPKAIAEHVQENKVLAPTQIPNKQDTVENTAQVPSASGTLNEGSGTNANEIVPISQHKASTSQVVLQQEQGTADPSGPTPPKARSTQRNVAHKPILNTDVSNLKNEEISTGDPSRTGSTIRNNGGTAQGFDNGRSNDLTHAALPEGTNSSASNAPSHNERKVNLEPNTIADPLVANDATNTPDAMLSNTGEQVHHAEGADHDNGTIANSDRNIKEDPPDDLGTQSTKSSAPTRSDPATDTAGTETIPEANNIVPADPLPKNLALDNEQHGQEIPQHTVTAPDSLGPPLLKPRDEAPLFANSLLVHAHGGLLFSTSNGSGNTEVSNLVDQSSASRPTPYFGLDLTFPAGGVSIGAGFHLTQYGELSSVPAAEFRTTEQLITDSSYTQTFVDSMWNAGTQSWFYFQIVDTLYTSDTTTNVTTITRQASSTMNRFTYMEVPLMAGRMWDKGRWLLGAQAGITVGILTGRKGRYPSTDLTGYVEASDMKYRSITLGYILRPMLHYKLSNHFAIGIEPSIRGHLTQLVQEGPLSGRKYFSYGIGAGLIYRFVQRRPFAE